jgi:hypothetical protein
MAGYLKPELLIFRLGFDPLVPLDRAAFAKIRCRSLAQLLTPNVATIAILAAVPLGDLPR